MFFFQTPGLGLGVDQSPTTQEFYTEDQVLLRLISQLFSIGQKLLTIQNIPLDISYKGNLSFIVFIASFVCIGLTLLLSLAYILY